MILTVKDAIYCLSRASNSSDVAMEAGVRPILSTASALKPHMRQRRRHHRAIGGRPAPWARKAPFADGSTYEGHWERGSMSGAGTLLQPNGDKYDGMWFRGLRSSSGIQTWARAPTAPGTATVKYTPVCCPCCRRSACRARSRLRLRQISRSQPPLGTPGCGRARCNRRLRHST